ncbi:hypothetical protein [Legionella adelaidensis]|nr:hypothetical protein [Legionella adelaidensis]
MKILYVNDVDFGTAATLVSITKKPAIQLNPDRPLDTPVEQVMLVAQTEMNASTLGGKTPKQLAADFAKLIPENRTALKHLYLIAPEAGLLIPDEEKTLAQKMAEELKHLGFDDVLLHAVSAPVNCNVGMHVEVTTDGYLHAYVYENAYSKEFDSALTQKIAQRDALIAKSSLTAAEVALSESLSAEIEQGKQQRKTDSNYKQVSILRTKNFGELNAPHNTYSSSGPMGTIGLPAAAAIAYLTNEKAQIAARESFFTRKKQHTYIDKNIAELKAKPLATMEEVFAILKGARTEEQLGKSHYVQKVVNPFMAAYKEMESTFPFQPGTPVQRGSQEVLSEDTPGSDYAENRAPFEDIVAGLDVSAEVGSPNESSALGLEAKKVEDLDLLRQELIAYADEREQGPVYKGHVLGFLASIAKGTAESDGRAFKVKAAGKLAAIISGETSDPLNDQEIGSLTRGDLGDLVRQFGGLDHVLSRTLPAAVSCSV